jgi:hypothetical protein
MAGTAMDLLADGAAGAGRIISGHQPAMSKDEYLEFMRARASEETFNGG